MATFPFLSEEWVDACRDLREEHRTASPSIPKLRMNLVVVDVPFGTGTVDAHLDTTHGEMEVDLAHLDKADLTVTIDYELAKTVLVEGALGAAIGGFRDGRVKVAGNTFKLMTLAGMHADAESKALAEKVRAITE